MPIRLLIPKFERITSVGKIPSKKWSDHDSIYKRLPEFYKRRHLEFRNRVPQAVHYIEKKKKFEVNHKTGEVKRVQNMPLPIIYPQVSKLGLWGGEGLIAGYKRPKKQRGHSRPQHLTTQIWKPCLHKNLFYSEILDKYYALTCTRRAIHLIEQAQGFDNYILQTHEVDLKSDIGMQIKREMLIALAKKDEVLWPNDPEKRNIIYNRYKAFAIPLEEAEWIGLKLWEAAKKQKQIEMKRLAESIKPFKFQFAQELIESLDKLNLEGKKLSVDDKNENSHIKQKGIFKKAYEEWLK